jgi:hypothetical protein
MGVWGTAIFSDDNASDVRDDYRRLVGDGLTGTEATDRLLHDWASSIDKDPDLAATFWLALAVTQWKCGRLEDRVRQEAIRRVDDGSALRAWRETEFERKRAAVLEATRRQLLSAQPPVRKIAKVFRSSCDWEPGELIAYRLLSGDFIVFQMIRRHQDSGGVAPECEIFDWQGPNIPQPSELEGLLMRPITPLRFKNDRPQLPDAKRPPTYRLMILQASKREFPKDRVFRLNAKLPIQHPPKPALMVDPTLVALWRDLDRQLELHYGFR